MFQLEPRTHNQGHCSAPGLLLHLLNLKNHRQQQQQHYPQKAHLGAPTTLRFKEQSSAARAVHPSGWGIVMITQLAMGMVTMKMTMMMMMMTTTMMMLTLAAAPHRLQTSWCNLHPLCFHQPSALSSPDHHDKG